MAELPPGFSPMADLSPFNALVGPLYEKRTGDDVVIGMFIQAKHANKIGICHGGVLATFADLSLGFAMHAKAGGKGSYVTAHLAIDYAGSAKVGDWIESAVEIQRVGTRLAFANGYLVAAGRRIVRASGIFARAEQD